MAKRTSSDSEDSGSAISEENKKLKAKHGDGETIRLLKSLLSDKDQQIQKLQKEKKLLHQTIRRQKSKLEKMEDQFNEERESRQNSLDIRRVADKTGDRGKSGSWLTPSGAISLAVSQPESRDFHVPTPGPNLARFCLGAHC